MGSTVKKAFKFFAMAGIFAFMPEFLFSQESLDSVYRLFSVQHTKGYFRATQLIPAVTRVMFVKS